MSGVSEPRLVRVDVEYLPDRTMRMLVTEADGPVEVGRAQRSGDLGRLARDGVRRRYGEDTDADLWVASPPWLVEGTLVRLTLLESGESHPYAQVVGFLPVGGAFVVHPESGAGVYAPEFLEPVDPAEVPDGILADVVRSSGRPPHRP